MTIDRDQELAWASAAQAGDRAAMELLLACLYDHVHAVCRRICANDADADDTTQDALISIVRALPTFDGRSAVRTWAHRIAANSALDELRRRGRRPIPSDDHAEATEPRTDAPGLADRVTDRLDLDAALAQLAPEFRAAVVLRDVVGMEYTEIATTLGVPVGTVRSRIARGRRHLAGLLGIKGNRSAPAGVTLEEP